MDDLEFDYEQDIDPDNLGLADALVASILEGINDDFYYPEEDFIINDKLNILNYVIRRLEANAKALAKEVYDGNL